MRKIFLVPIFTGTMFGVIQITPEIGANVGINDNKFLTYGAYSRLWLGVNDFVLAPQVRWELNKDYSNIKAGMNWRRSNGLSYPIYWSFLFLF